MHQESDDRNFNIRLLFSPDYTMMSIIIESDDVIDEKDFKWVMKKLSKMSLSKAEGEDGLQ